LREKFDLDFHILTRERVEASYTANPFMEESVLIVRMDQLARSDELQSKLAATDWDLVVVDEAHKMSAHFEGDDVRETKRYRLGRLLGRITRHLLLLTATPHTGHSEDFQLFLALLDPDRFEGRRSGQAEDTSDLWRRMVKEKLLRFDGRPLFPERVATTVNFPLSEGEAELYERVTDYVRNEMNRADRLAGSQRAVVGFALTGLQRRLASSPEAIYRSLVRRRERLELRLATSDEPPAASPSDALQHFEQLIEDEEVPDLVEAEGDRAEEIDEAVVDEASAALTRAELSAEIASLAELEKLAFRVRQSGTDTKWVELRGLLDELPPSADKPHKLIIFTEHRDTLTYLASIFHSGRGVPELETRKCLV
jgi:ERCC4-related helicase